VAEAARWYFDAPVESLDVARSALLAGLIPAPNAYSPFRDLRRAQARRDAVLGGPGGHGDAGRPLGRPAAALPLAVRRGPLPAALFPSYVGYVRQHLSEHLPEGAAEHWGLSVFTTLDLVWQAEAEAGGWPRGWDSLEALERARPQPLQRRVLVALDPATGHVRAVVGGARPGRATSTGPRRRGARPARRSSPSSTRPRSTPAAARRGSAPAPPCPT